MFFPYGTDAPIYHFPWMTVALIIANFVTFYQTGGGINHDGWLLTYGDGFRPLEWLTYNFLHFTALHLIGNMFFLWSFGIVVEGKLGWYRFLMLYVGIGVLGGVIIQASAIWSSFNDSPRAVRIEAQQSSNKLSPDGEHAEVVPATFRQRGAGGASLAISGLMAIVLVWAPRNDVLCFWFWFIYYFVVGTFRVQYIYFCGIFILLDLYSSGVFSGEMSFGTASGHTAGALIGFVAGIVYLKLNWVDCEDWDLFNAFKERRSSFDEVGNWRKGGIR